MTIWSRDDRALRVARRAFAREGLARAVSVEDLIRRAAAISGVDIEVQFTDEVDRQRPAQTVNQAHRSVIVLCSRDAAYYRARGIFHELAHIFLRHPACANFGSVPGQTTHQVDLKALYDNDPQEAEAEALATLLEAHVLRLSNEIEEAAFG